LVNFFKDNVDDFCILINIYQFIRGKLLLHRLQNIKSRPDDRPKRTFIAVRGHRQRTNEGSIRIEWTCQCVPGWIYGSIKWNGELLLKHTSCSCKLKFFVYENKSSIKSLHTLGS